MNKVILFGASGKLGKELHKLYPNALAPSHVDLDITDYDKLTRFFTKESIDEYDTIINLVAGVSPPQCEKNKGWAWRTTVEGTQNLTEIINNLGLKFNLGLMSTPCIFSGNGPYDEYSIPNPDGQFYGFTKVIQETIIKNSRQNWMVFRANFVPYEKWAFLKAFSDRTSNYLFAHDLARAIKETIEECEWNTVYHLVGTQEMTMLDLARLCPDSQNTLPYTLEEYYAEHPNSGKLTKDMRLDTINRKKKFDLTFPTEGIK